MSVFKELLLCELCLTNRVSKEPVKVHIFLSDFYNLLQQLFENFNIDVPVNEIQTRMCSKCAGKILTMCEDLESWRAAQSKRATSPNGTALETVTVKTEPPDTEAESESMEQNSSSSFYEDIELTDVKLEVQPADKEDLSKSDDENLLIIPQTPPSINANSPGIHRLQSSVVVSVRRYNCNHPGCTSSFAYKRAYETHINKCHLDLKVCRKLKKNCQTHNPNRIRENKSSIKLKKNCQTHNPNRIRENKSSIQNYHYDDSGQGHFIAVKEKPIVHKKPELHKKKPPMPKRDFKFSQYDGKGLGQFIKLNTVKTLQKS